MTRRRSADWTEEQREAARQRARKWWASRDETERKACGAVLSEGRAIPSALLVRLAPHAARRGVTPANLARRILTVVLDAKLVDAVLDDSE